MTEHKYQSGTDATKRTETLTVPEGTSLNRFGRNGMHLRKL